MRVFSRKALVVIAAFVLCMLAAFALKTLGLRNESVFMVFILGVMLTVLEVRDYYGGIVLGILLVFGFNFFFAEPEYTFTIYDANYYVSFAVFIAVSIIVNTLTSRLQREAVVANDSAQTAERLYRTSDGFLKLSGEDRICAYARSSLSHLLEREVTVSIADGPSVAEGGGGSTAVSPREDTGGQADIARHVTLPIEQREMRFGSVDIDCEGKPLDASERRLAEAVVSQMTLALEREGLEREKRRSQMETERERFKNSLLRSLSHDLRTPLMSIAGGAGFLRTSGSDVDEKTTREVLSDIESDAIWLSGMVENLLVMTRMQDAEVPLSMKNEVVDDILSEAIARTAKRKGEHELLLSPPDTVLLVPMDGRLVLQVLVNLIENAFKHTRGDSIVEVSARQVDGGVEFSVSDDGGGIDPALKDHIFDRFFSGTQGDAGSVHGVGLGLSICRSIVEAHGGTIGVHDNDRGGATFTFVLPGQQEGASEDG